jgi:hypothetical protein
VFFFSYRRALEALERQLTGVCSVTVQNIRRGGVVQGSGDSGDGDSGNRGDRGDGDSGDVDIAMGDRGEGDSVLAGVDLFALHFSELCQVVNSSYYQHSSGQVKDAGREGGREETQATGAAEVVVAGEGMDAAQVVGVAAEVVAGAAEGVVAADEGEGGRSDDGSDDIDIEQLFALRAACIQALMNEMQDAPPRGL